VRIPIHISVLTCDQQSNGLHTCVNSLLMCVIVCVNQKSASLVDGKELPGGGGYRYFGRAKDLPGVKELFEQQGTLHSIHSIHTSKTPLLNKSFFYLLEFNYIIVLGVYRSASRRECENKVGTVQKCGFGLLWV
jgi:hypothetical protein